MNIEFENKPPKDFGTILGNMVKQILKDQP